MEKVTKYILDLLDNLEALGVEIASKLAPWLAPALSAVVVGRAVMAPPFEWPIWLAWLTGGAIEFSGVATLSTALMLWSYRTDQPEGRKPSWIPLVLAAICAFGYLITALALTVVLKAIPEFQVVSYGLFVLLALTSAINLAVRRDHMRRLQSESPNGVTRPGQSRRKPANDSGNKPPQAQTRDEKINNLNRANEARKPTQEAYNLAKVLKDSDLSWGQVADELGVSKSTAKRWYRLAEPTPVSVNGNGVSHD